MTRTRLSMTIVTVVVACSCVLILMIGMWNGHAHNDGSLIGVLSVWAWGVAGLCVIVLAWLYRTPYVQVRISRVLVYLCLGSSQILRRFTALQGRPMTASRTRIIFDVWQERLFISFAVLLCCSYIFQIYLQRQHPASR